MWNLTLKLQWYVLFLIKYVFIINSFQTFNKAPVYYPVKEKSVHSFGNKFPKKYISYYGGCT